MRTKAFTLLELLLALSLSTGIITVFLFLHFRLTSSLTHSVQSLHETFQLNSFLEAIQQKFFSYNNSSFDEIVHQQKFIHPSTFLCILNEDLFSNKQLIQFQMSPSGPSKILQALRSETLAPQSPAITHSFFWSIELESPSWEIFLGAGSKQSSNQVFLCGRNCYYLDDNNHWQLIPRESIRKIRILIKKPNSKLLITRSFFPFET